MTGVRRTPLYFGSDDRPLFGWMHSPVAKRRDLAVVICPPAGHEYINSHRSLRHLADEAARRGITALRFDYDGCGDSAGSDDDPERFAAWLASVRRALCTVRTVSGCSRVAMVGLRLGATLATLATLSAQEEEQDAIDALVLWVPCVRGRGYLRELKAVALTGTHRDAASGNDSIEPGGFLFSRETQASIGCIDISTAPPHAQRILIASRDDLPLDSQLRDAWRAAGRLVEQRTLPGFVRMMDVAHNALVPEPAITDIADWLAEQAGDPVDAPAAPRLRDSFTWNGLRESVVHMPAVAGEHGFFGILCEPEKSRGGPIVLLPNAGATHHVGPNRLYVLLARALAEAGLRTLRFDLPGLGDNPASDPSADNQVYVPQASSVIASAVAAMKQRRATERFVLMGLCSGAHTSFHAALDLDDAAIAECVLINPLTFYYKPGMSLDQPSSHHYQEWQRYMRSMRSVSGWAKLFRDDVRLAEIARNVLLRFRDIARNKLEAARESLRGRSAAGGGDNLDADLRRLARSNRRVSFIFSRFDPGYDLLMINAGRAVRFLSRRRLLSLWRIDDANHTFEAKRSRDVMIASVAEHLTRTYLQ